MLHITNGDSAATGLRRAGLPGVVLPWRDVLHEGPVPAGLPLDRLGAVRARFLADSGRGDYDEVRAAFAHRDGVLAGFREHEEVVLWFEHDLYDQLQLLQLLDWFADQDRAETALTLICIGAFPGRERFLGLGELTPAQLGDLFPTRAPVTDGLLALGRAAWHAFRAPDPRAVEFALDRDTSALPFLAAALRRHLEEFPAVEHGLSRTERQLLAVVAAGGQTPVGIFLAAQEQEERPFMGDLTAWAQLRRLSSGGNPLVTTATGGAFTLPPDPRQAPDETFLRQRVVLTMHGGRVLGGRADQVQLNGIDRWLGGVHLHGPEAPWRWDGRGRRLVRPGTPRGDVADA